MIVAVRGVHFRNSGSLLMLLAILRQLPRMFGDVVVAADLRCGTWHQRTSLGVRHLARAESRRLAFADTLADAGARLLPPTLRRSLQIVQDREVGLVLDASGFAYGDQWGEAAAGVLADHIERWRRQGKAVVLLPQAFGPFGKLGVRQAAIRIVRSADLIFARDEVSRAHLLGLGLEVDHIRLAPDFTPLLAGSLPPNWQHHDQPCIIPNSRMINRTSLETREAYPEFLALCANYFLDLGMTPFLLVLELGQDYDLARAVASRLPRRIPIIVEPDPVAVKGILSVSLVVVSSRYHGLVSALSQGVPCLATGWTHKYRMLLEDYGCPECLASVREPRRDVMRKLDMIAQNPSRAHMVAGLKSAAQRQVELSQGMWAEVAEVVAGRWMNEAPLSPGQETPSG